MPTHAQLKTGAARMGTAAGEKEGFRERIGCIQRFPASSAARKRYHFERGWACVFGGAAKSPYREHWYPNQQQRLSYSVAHECMKARAHPNISIPVSPPTSFDVAVSRAPLTQLHT